MSTSMPTVIAVFIATFLIFTGVGIHIDYVSESGTDIKADASPDAKSNMKPDASPEAKSDIKPDAPPGGSKMPRPKQTAYSPAGMAAIARDSFRIAKEVVAARLVSRKKDTTGGALAEVKPAGESEAATANALTELESDKPSPSSSGPDELTAQEVAALMMLNLEKVAPPAEAEAAASQAVIEPKAAAPAAEAPAASAAAEPIAKDPEVGASVPGAAAGAAATENSLRQLVSGLTAKITKITGEVKEKLTVKEEVAQNVDEAVENEVEPSARAAANEVMWRGPFNSGYPGTSIKVFTVTSMEECKAKCVEEAQCQAIIQASKDEPDNAHKMNCVMFNTQADVASSKDKKTLQVFKYMRKATWSDPLNTGIPGNGIEAFNAATLEECKDKCVGNVQCQAVQYSATETDDAHKANCVMFDTQADTNPKYKETFQIYKYMNDEKQQDKSGASFSPFSVWVVMILCYMASA